MELRKSPLAPCQEVTSTCSGRGDLTRCSERGSTMPPLALQFYSDDDDDEDDSSSGSSSSDSSSEESSEDDRSLLTAEIGRLQIKNSQLNSQVRSLKSGQGSANSSQSASCASSTTASAIDIGKAECRRQRNLGKSITALSDLWPKSSTFGRPRPERFRDPHPWQPERCESAAAWEEGNVAELYHIVPEASHALIEGSPHFVKMVKDGARAFRSNMISNTRDEAALIFAIPGMNKEHFAIGHDRSAFPAITDLLKSPKNPDEEYALFPRVLFTNYEVVETELFGSSAILKILKVILLGPKSLIAGPGPRSGPRGSAYSWEMDKVTPGCIAMAAVVAQFLLSPDRSFSEKGGTSKINYRERFIKYKQFIIENFNKARMKALMDRLNAQLFLSEVHDDEPTLPPVVEQVPSEVDDFNRAFSDSEDTPAEPPATATEPPAVVTEPPAVVTEPPVGPTEPSTTPPTSDPLTVPGEPSDAPVTPEDTGAAYATEHTTSRSRKNRNKGGKVVVAEGSGVRTRARK